MWRIKLTAHSETVIWDRIAITAPTFRAIHT